MKVLGCPCKYRLSSVSSKATEYVQGCMQIQYRKVRLRVQDVEQQSAITSTGSAGVLRHLPPPVAQNGSTGKREGGSVWCGCLLLVWFSTIGMVFYYWYGFLQLVWFSTIGVDFYHWCGFLSLV